MNRLAPPILALLVCMLSVPVRFPVGGAFHGPAVAGARDAHAASPSGNASASVRAGRWVDARAFGLAPEGAAGANDAAFRRALEQLPSGGTLFVPDGAYEFNRITISAGSVTLALAPGAVLKPALAADNAIVVTGANCTIAGGTIQSPPAWDDRNVKWAYAVIWVAGDGFTARALRIDNVPKVGIGIKEAADAMIEGCRIAGNFPPQRYASTGHFGIAIDPPAAPRPVNAVIRGNIVTSCVQGIYSGNYGAAADGSGINVTGNTFHECLDHGIYLGVGTRAPVVASNTFTRCAYPIAVEGKSASVAGNTIYTGRSGGLTDRVSISIRDAEFSVVSGNTIHGDPQHGGTMLDLASLNGKTVQGNVVTGNVIHSTGKSGAPAIKLAAKETLKDNLVSNNIINANGYAGFGLIQVSVGEGHYGINNTIDGNHVAIRNNAHGIVAIRQRQSVIRNNVLRLEYSAASPETIKMIHLHDVFESVIQGNTLYCDNTYGRNVILEGISEGASSSRNFIHDNFLLLDKTLLSGTTFVAAAPGSSLSRNVTSRKDKLHGVFTWSGGASIRVANENTTSEKNIQILPLDENAAKVMRDQGIFVRSATPGSQFVLGTGDGNPPKAAGEFSYIIY